MAQLVLHGRQGRDRGVLGRSQRADAVVEMRDQDAPVAVAHAGHELGRHHGRIGDPVAVVPVVERMERTVDGHLHAAGPARPEVELHPPRLVHRRVADQPEVGLQQRGVGLQHGLQVRRAPLLLSLPEDLDVHRRPPPRRLQRVQRREHSDDRRLVVAGGPPVQPPLRIERPSRLAPVDLGAPRPHHRDERV